MKKAMLSIMLFISFEKCFPAVAETGSSDTSASKKDYKMSRKQFLEEFGKDDSSRAMINYY